MAVVTFWSNGKEETAKTLSIAAIATNMAIEHNYKTLLMSTNYNDFTLESCYWPKQMEEEITKINDISAGRGVRKSNIDSGIEGLAKVITANRATPEVITNYTRVVFKNRLEVLLAIKSKSYDEYSRLRSLYADILKVASHYYDLIFVDLNKGLEDKFMKEILENSDLVITNLSQRLPIIDSFIKIREQEKMFKKNNNMILIGRYDRFSKYTAKNIARYIGIKDDILVIPYNTLFFEACNEGTVADFFLRFKTINESDRNAVFIKEVNKTTEKIIYKLQELQMRM